MAENIGVKSTRGPPLDYENDGDALGPPRGVKISLTKDVLAPGSDSRRGFDVAYRRFMTNYNLDWWDSLIRYMDDCFDRHGRSWVVLEADKLKAEQLANRVENRIENIYNCWEKVWDHTTFLRRFASDVEEEYLDEFNNGEGMDIDVVDIRNHENIENIPDEERYCIDLGEFNVVYANADSIKIPWKAYLSESNELFLVQRDENMISTVSNAMRIYLLSLVTLIVDELHYLNFVELKRLSKLVKKQEAATARHNSVRPGGELYKQARQRYETRDYEDTLEQLLFENEHVGQTKPMRIPRSFFKT